MSYHFRLYFVHFLSGLLLAKKARENSAIAAPSLLCLLFCSGGSRAQVKVGGDPRDKNRARYLVPHLDQAPPPNFPILTLLHIGEHVCCSLFSVTKIS